jgi:hypothetical protein
VLGCTTRLRHTGRLELLYRELRDAGDGKILPLTMNIADPSPGLGWCGLERKPLLERGRPDLVLALALVHHVAIGSNVPVMEIVDWLATLGGVLLVEFPTRTDRCSAAAGTAAPLTYGRWALAGRRPTERGR